MEWVDDIWNEIATNDTDCDPYAINCTSRRDRCDYHDRDPGPDPFEGTDPDNLPGSPWLNWDDGGY